MKTYRTYGFRRLPGDLFQATALTVTEPLPLQTTTSPDALRTTYRIEAAKILEMLLASVPQGTLDQLLIALLESRASYYVGKPGTP